MDYKDMKFNTKIIHAGQEHDPITGAHVSPIYQTSTYVFKSTDEAIRLNQNQDQGFTYTRFGSPSAAELEKKIAILENAEAALAVGSGMAAISTALLTVLKNGDHVIAGDVIYGCTFALIKNVLTDFGIKISLVDTSDLSQVEEAIRPNTKCIYVETPANPVLRISDIEEISKIAHKNGAKLIVDSTFASPYLQKPIELGADLVVHSGTKFLCGHGTVVAGVIAGSKKLIDRARFPILQVFGSVISPFDAWLLMQGMKTLGIRMERQCENAMKVAEFLDSHPQVEKVYYPGLPSHTTHKTAKKQMHGGFGGMMSADIKGGLKAGKILMDNVKVFSLATSLGNIDSLIQHSPTMSHFDMSKEEREKVGIKDGQVRISVGVEDVDDLIADLDQALKIVEKECN
ncbi:MAG TPA: aminotransferase class I/II-fold pyridoxal phosphate-dependent enzyme [Tissierellales bacterium]|nr:aminotransferase class I/II-fold pyridoxal phosphate-dependent enzyme [Tissierellales bacterium]